MSASTPVLLFGGTFDPVHVAHLRMAVEARECVAAQRVWMVPCHIPSHRDKPGANSEQRLAMLRAAIDGQTGIDIDDRELRRQGASYTVDTLSEWRREVGPDRPLIWCMGSDAFAGIDRWHRWQSLLQLAHVLVLERPGQHLPDDSIAAGLLKHRAATAEEIGTQAAGGILRFQPTQLMVSATDIRARVEDGRSLQYLVPDAVAALIRDYGLYTGPMAAVSESSE